MNEYPTQQLQNLQLHLICVSVSTPGDRGRDMSYVSSMAQVGCARLSQKLVQCSAFPILLGIVLSVFCLSSFGYAQVLIII